MIAISLSLFAVLCVAWCLLPNAPTAAREEPAHGGAMQEA